MIQCRHQMRDVNMRLALTHELQLIYLDIQHKLFTLLLDGELACAPLADGPNHVLDIGTG